MERKQSTGLRTMASSLEKLSLDVEKMVGINNTTAKTIENLQSSNNSLRKKVEELEQKLKEIVEG